MHPYDATMFKILTYNTLTCVTILPQILNKKKLYKSPAPTLALCLKYDKEII